MKLTDEQQKKRDEIEDEFMLLTTISIVQDYLKEKKEKEQQQTAQPAGKSAKEGQQS